MPGLCGRPSSPRFDSTRSSQKPTTRPAHWTHRTASDRDHQVAVDTPVCSLPRPLPEETYRQVLELHGIGPRQAGALHEYGIHTVSRLAAISPATTQRLLGGRASRTAADRARGIDTRPIVPRALPPPRPSGTPSTATPWTAPPSAQPSSSWSCAAARLQPNRPAQLQHRHRTVGRSHRAALEGHRVRRRLSHGRRQAPHRGHRHEPAASASSSSSLLSASPQADRQAVLPAGAAKGITSSRC